MLYFEMGLTKMHMTCRTLHNDSADLWKVLCLFLGLSTSQQVAAVVLEEERCHTHTYNTRTVF